MERKPYNRRGAASSLGSTRRARPRKHGKEKQPLAGGSRYQCNIGNPTAILLINVEDQKLAITTKVIDVILVKEGLTPVLKVQIYPDSRLNERAVLVQFPDESSASHALSKLNGQEIYQDCCRLHISYWDKSTDLAIYKNDKDSWDYTAVPQDSNKKNGSRPKLQHEHQHELQHEHQHEQQHEHLYEHPYGHLYEHPYGHPYESQYDHKYRHHPGRSGAAMHSLVPYQEITNHRMRPARMVAYRRHTETPRQRPPRRFVQESSPPTSAAARESTTDAVVNTTESRVLVMSGLNCAYFNCDTAFNLLCVFGIITKVKFFHERSAFVEMLEPKHIREAVAGLKNMIMFGNKLNIEVSHNLKLEAVSSTCGQLQDGTSMQKDFLCGINQKTIDRFKSRNQVAKKELYFYNAPVDFDTNQLARILAEWGLHFDFTLQKFASRNQNSVCSSGKIILSSKTQAAEIIVVLNNHEFMRPDLSNRKMCMKVFFYAGEFSRQ